MDRMRIVAFVALVSLMLFLGATQHTLMREDAGIVHSLTYGTALTDATLNAAVAAIGNTKTALLVSPGTWTIANNLTVPAHIALWIAPGAIFSVNGGRTLTINGALRVDHPLQHIFSGSGTVVLGSGVLDLLPHWWGAVCDGSADDTSALQKAATAGNTHNRPVRIPAGSNCKITSQVTLPPGVGIVGDSIVNSRITHTGVSNAIVYNALNEQQDLHVVFRDFTLRGSVAGGSLKLLSVLNSWNVDIERVSVRGGTVGIYTNFAAGTNIRACEVGETSSAHIWLDSHTTNDFSNTASVVGCRFQEFGVATTAGQLRMTGASTWIIMGNAFEVAPGGGTNYHIVLENSSLNTIKSNFLENAATAAIVCRPPHAPHSDGGCSLNDISNNHVFTANTDGIYIDFSLSAAAHKGNKITHNVFPFNKPPAIYFHPGASTSYTFEQNTRATPGAEPSAWVAGFPGNVIQNIYKFEGSGLLLSSGATNEGTLMLGKSDSFITRQGPSLLIQHDEPTGAILLMYKGAERARIDADGVRTAGADYNEPVLRMERFYFWVGTGGCAGRLMFKSGKPASECDGTMFFNGQQGANPDTTGATLTQLEAEINELKAALRNVGLLAQ